MPKKFSDRIRALNIAKAYIDAEIRWSLPSLASYAVLLPVLLLIPIRQTECASREVGPCGFVGNSDFYGLGIRAGIYLQWLASLISHVKVPSQSRTMAASNMIFSLASFIAMFFLTYHIPCTYEAEIMILLFILWGGSMAIVLPMVRSPDYGERGIVVVWSIWGTPTVVYTCWFWINMAKGNNSLFAETPCGTSVFLLGHVTSENIQAMSIIVSIITVSFAAAMLFAGIGSVNDKKPSRFLLWTQRGLILTWLPMVATSCILLLLAFICALICNPKAAYDTAKRTKYEQPTATTIQVLRALFREEADAIFTWVAFVVYFFTVLAMELTLFWNSVTGIYSLDTTGQFIPLVIGVGTLLSLFWDLLQKPVSVVLLLLV